MYRKSTNGWLKHGDFILLDLICLQIAFVLSYILRHGMQNPYANESYRDMAVFLAVADLLVIFFFESFKGVLRRGLYQEFATSVKHVILVELVAAGYLFAIHGGSAYSRISFFSMGLIYDQYPVAAVYHIGYGIDIAADTVVIWTRKYYGTDIFIFFQCFCHILRIYHSHDTVIFIHFRLQIYRSNISQFKCRICRSVASP